MLRSLIVLIALTVSQATTGQVSLQRAVVSGLYNKQPVDITSLTAPVLKEKDRADKSLKPGEALEFAIPLKVNFGPENSGEIIVNEDGSQIWILGIKSESARSLNLIFEPFALLPGESVTVYSPDGRFIAGRFTEINNKLSGILPVMPVPGEEIVIEYHVPAGKPSGTRVTITQIAHDYRGDFGEESNKPGRFGLSQPCNIDINCSFEERILLNSRSVARLIIGGFRLCTGVMINSAGKENDPLLLTAGHCVLTNLQAAQTLFLFNYESPWCSGPNGSVNHSLAGSDLLIRDGSLDYSLLRLSLFPPITYTPYLAGWDVSGSVPSSTYTIHHPGGDVKKISRDNDAPLTGSFLNYTKNGFWHIVEWDQGSTEGGSSGAPLFTEYGAVTGLLSGGASVCGNSFNDYFSKLYAGYITSGQGEGSLKSFIDPEGYGFLTYGGRDPYERNIAENDTLNGEISSNSLFLTELLPPGAGYTTGFSSDTIEGYALKFSAGENRDLLRLRILPGKAGNFTSEDSIIFFIMNGTNSPENIIASEKIAMSWFRENEYSEVDFGLPVKTEGVFFAGWRLKYSGSGSPVNRQFALYHTNDFIDPALNRAWFLRDGVWREFSEHPSMPGSFSLSLLAIMTGSSELTGEEKVVYPEAGIRLWPNPAREHLNIDNIPFSGKVSLSVYDVTGREHYRTIAEAIPSGIITIPLNMLGEGVYIVRLRSDSRQVSGWFIKSR